MEDKLLLENLYKEVKIEDNGFLINPKEYILVSLNETLNILEKINAHIRPRTRFVRAGPYVSTQHCNSTYSGNLKIGVLNFLNISIHKIKELRTLIIIGVIIAFFIGMGVNQATELISSYEWTNNRIVMSFFTVFFIGITIAIILCLALKEERKWER